MVESVAFLSVLAAIVMVLAFLLRSEGKNIANLDTVLTDHNTLLGQLALYHPETGAIARREMRAAYKAIGADPYRLSVIVGHGVARPYLGQALIGASRPVVGEYFRAFRAVVEKLKYRDTNQCAAFIFAGGGLDPAIGFDLLADLDTATRQVIRQGRVTVGNLSGNPDFRRFGHLVDATDGVPGSNPPVVPGPGFDAERACFFGAAILQDIAALAQDQRIAMARFLPALNRIPEQPWVFTGR